MSLPQAIDLVRHHAQRMAEAFQGPVFDEWAVVELTPQHGRVLFYEGTRREGFTTNFAGDLAALRADLMGQSYDAGDFAFTKAGAGTAFDAFLALGDGRFLICNNVTSSMEIITRNPRWLGAQRAFVDLSEAIRLRPVGDPLPA